MTGAQTDALRLITRQLKNLAVKAPKDSEASSHLKLPTIRLPSLKKSESGVVSARTYYTWKSTLSQIIRHHNMSPKSIHTHYSTSIDLLPKQYAEAFQNSRDLRSALESLDAQFAPLSSVHSDLVQQLLNFPPLNFPTETQRIARANQIITILEDMRRFFSDDASKDLNRQQCLVILSNMSGSTENRDHLARAARRMDAKRRSGVLYVESLHEELAENRLLAIDVNAAMKLCNQSLQRKKERSAAVREKKKADQQQVEQKPPNNNNDNNNGNNGDRRTNGFKKRPPWKNPWTEKENPCCICDGGKHREYHCEKGLEKIRDGTLKLNTAKVCRYCLRQKTVEVENEHKTPACGMKRIRKSDGVYVILDFRCKTHDQHYRLCSCQTKANEKIDSNQNPSRERSAAFRHRAVTIDSARSASNYSPDENQVVFLNEDIYLKAQNGDTLSCLVSFDNHGTKSFISGEIPAIFKWNASAEQEILALQTIHGDQVTQHEIMELQLVTLKGLVNIKALEGTWSTEPEPGLNAADAAEFDIAVPEMVAKPRLILCARHIDLFPKEVSEGFEQLKKRHPKIRVFESMFTLNKLVCGELSHAASNQQ